MVLGRIIDVSVQSVLATWRDLRSHLLMRRSPCLANSSSLLRASDSPTSQVVKGPVLALFQSISNKQDTLAPLAPAIPNLYPNVLPNTYPQWPGSMLWQHQQFPPQHMPPLQQLMMWPQPILWQQTPIWPTQMPTVPQQSQQQDGMLFQLSQPDDEYTNESSQSDFKITPI